MATRVTAADQRSGQVLDRPVLVGVDPGGRSTSAVLWAVEESGRTGRTLRVTSACPDEPSARADEPAVRNGLAALARRLAIADLACEVAVGQAPDVLLGAAASSSLLVVGRHGRGGGHRHLPGSTSMAVAGGSPVPVVVVPDRWVQPVMSSAPVVVGVDAGDPTSGGRDRELPDGDREALDFAFDRAARLRVPVMVVNAFDFPPLHGWSAEDIGAYRSRYEEALGLRLRPWRDQHPDVEVVPACVAERPAGAVLEAARVAQLTVLGRRSSGSPASGRGLGSTTRGVLHRADRPVAVVPVPARM
ncbi:MAG: universal stress protein [Nocardioidaceae bacterium]